MSHEALLKQAEVAAAEAAFQAAKEAGLARYQADKEKAFLQARTVAEYEEYVANIPPPVTVEAKQALRQLRQDYRLNYRDAAPIAGVVVRPGGGHAPQPSEVAEAPPVASRKKWWR